MKILDSSLMARLDKQSQEEYGLSSPVLMENAGIRLWDEFKVLFCENLRDDSAFIFLSGSGNNGGDACVMARHAWLDGYKNIAIVTITPEAIEKDNSAYQKTICEKFGIPLLDWNRQKKKCRTLLAGASFVFDGLCGTGIKGELRPPLAGLVKEANRVQATRIALDVPTGLGDFWRKGFEVFQARHTFTIGLPLQCLYLPAARAYAGDIRVVPISFPEALTKDGAIPGELTAWRDWRDRVATPDSDAHKTRRGHCGVFAGSPGTFGAGLLAAQAAARSRAGMVSLFLPGELAAGAAAASPGLMAKSWSPKNEPAGLSLSRYNSLLAGPGWGLDFPEERRKWLDVFFQSGIKGVLDADGLRVFSQVKGSLPPPDCWVFTPHPGEFAGLAGLPADSFLSPLLENPLPSIRKYSRSLGVVLVLKANVTFIAEPAGRYWIVDGQNPALACAGSGDVLAGIIAGFLALGMAPAEAAAAGVSLHQEAGRRVFAKQGWFMAQDLLPEISGILGETNNHYGFL